MALTTDQIFGLELKARLHADDLRKEVAAHPGTTPAFKLIDDAKLSDAKAFDQVGDLLKGLRGSWDMGAADLVRDGFKREARAYDKAQTYVLAVVEAPATDDLVTDEAAA